MPLSNFMHLRTSAIVLQSLLGIYSQIVFFLQKYTLFKDLTLMTFGIIFIKHILFCRIENMGDSVRHFFARHLSGQNDLIRQAKHSPFEG